MPTVREYAEAVSLSRIHAGVHHRFTNDVGVPMARRVTQMAMGHLATTLAK